MSTRPRNPRYFPRMKVRGARRRRMAPFQRMVGGFDQVEQAASVAALAFSMGLNGARLPSNERKTIPGTSGQGEHEKSPQTGKIGTEHEGEQ